MSVQRPKPSTTFTGAWGVLCLLFVINRLNFVDRMIPAVVLEDIRRAYGLSDLWLGILVSSFTVALALGGRPLGARCRKTSQRHRCCRLPELDVDTPLLRCGWCFLS